jgi:hypothetical protein
VVAGGDSVVVVVAAGSVVVVAAGSVVVVAAASVVVVVEVEVEGVGSTAGLTATSVVVGDAGFPDPG